LLWSANYLFLGAETALGTVRLGLFARYNAEMTDRIRIIKHEAIPGCGSFEVCFADGRVSQYFYFDDLPGRRLRPQMLTREQALEAATALARGAVNYATANHDVGADRCQRSPTVLNQETNFS
jgi:hypothetical protein